MPFGLFESTRITPQINHHSALTLVCTIIYSYYQLLQSLPKVEFTWFGHESTNPCMLRSYWLYICIMWLLLITLAWCWVVCRESQQSQYTAEHACFLFRCLLSEFSCLYATISDDCSWFSSSTRSHTVLLNGPNSAVQFHLNSQQCRNLK